MLYVLQIKIKCYKYCKNGHKSRDYTEKKKTSTVCTEEHTNTLLKTVTVRRITGKNLRTITRRFTKKRSSIRNKKMTKIMRRIRIVSLKRYIMMGYFLTMTQLCERMKQQTRKLRKFFLMTQDLRHIWLAALKIWQTHDRHTRYLWIFYITSLSAV